MTTTQEIIENHHKIVNKLFNKYDIENMQKAQPELDLDNNKEWVSKTEIKKKLNNLLEFEYPDIITEIEEFIEVLE